MTALYGGPLLFVSSSESGRINPLLAIASDLGRRGGVPLVFATTEDCRGEIEALPATPPVRFASLGEPNPEHLPKTWDNETFEAFTVSSRAQAVSAYLERVTDADFLQTVYDRLLAIVDEVKPALIIADQDVPYAFDAALARDIPYVMTVPIPLGAVYGHRVPADYPKTFTGLPLQMTPQQLEQNEEFAREVGEWAGNSARIKKFVEQRVAAGFTNPACVSSVYADGARSVLGLTVFGVEYEFPDLPDNLTMVGALIPSDPAEREMTSLTGWLDEHESIVYIGFGTIMRPSAGQIAALVEAVRRLPDRHHVLWRLPESQQKLLPPREELPANLRIESWLPSQTEVLAHPHVKVFFNHGGGNAVSEGSYFGTPQLVMPFWMDCYDWAARVVDSGIGLTVEYSAEPDPQWISGQLNRLLEEELFAERAQHWSERQREAGGLKAASEIVLEHATAAEQATQA
ncbi:glycosyltransferase [Streptomyces sp. NPDC048483]|uniref:glycosyltransferase n=1 Tax=Streptomyces sp. NPDC048483 TaxID=3154927 RepID=UPI00343DE7CE